MPSSAEDRGQGWQPPWPPPPALPPYLGATYIAPRRHCRCWRLWVAVALSIVTIWWASLYLGWDAATCQWWNALYLIPAGLTWIGICHINRDH